MAGLSEDRYRLIDVWMKAVGGSFALASLVLGGWQYIDTQQRAMTQAHKAETRRLRASREARDRQFRWSIWEKKLSGYMRISDAAADVAVATGEDELKRAGRAWERLYWGNVTTMDHPEVIEAMDDLRSAIENTQAGLRPMGSLSREDDLKRRAHHVVRALRAAIDAERQRFLDSPCGD